VTQRELAEAKLQGMLKTARVKRQGGHVVGLPKKSSYTPAEVQAILGISDRTFWRMVSGYEIDPDTEAPLNPATLDSYMLNRTRRVRYDELVEYLARNNTYQRNNAADPKQMAMF